MNIQPHNLSPPRVLVVEADQSAALDLEEALATRGLCVIALAGSVDQALRILDVARPDVAVLGRVLCGESSAPVAERLCCLNIPFLFTAALPWCDAVNLRRPEPRQAEGSAHRPRWFRSHQ